MTALFKPLFVLQLLAALVAGAPPHARAQSADDPAAQTDRFDALVDRAVAHYRAGRFEQAATDFEAAYAIDPQPELIYNQARAYEKALRTEDAIAAYARFIELPGTTAELRALALDSMAALEREAEARERRSARAEVPPAPSPPASPPAARPAAPSAGVRAPAVEPRGTDRTAEWVLLGAGAALAVGGGVMGALALDRKTAFDDAVAARAPVAEVEELRDEASRNASIADGLLVAGAAVGVTGLVLFLVRGDDAESVSVAPFAAETGAGVVLGGPF